MINNTGTNVFIPVSGGPVPAFCMSHHQTVWTGAAPLLHLWTSSVKHQLNMTEPEHCGSFGVKGRRATNSNTKDKRKMQSIYISVSVPVLAIPLQIVNILQNEQKSGETLIG